MSKKKSCKKCKMFVEGDTCPNCKTSSFTNNWQGRLYVADTERSHIAKQVKVEMKGEYAIKVR